MPRLKGIRHLRLFVLPRDWRKSLGFYGKKLGLELRHRDDAAGYAIYALSRETTLGIEKVASKDPEDLALVGRFAGVSFGVEDIARTYRELKAKGVRFHSPPSKQPWGGTLAHLDDPAGNVLTLLQSAASGRG